jgi:hypothetical protein
MTSQDNSATGLKRQSLRIDTLQHGKKFLSPARSMTNIFMIRIQANINRVIPYNAMRTLSYDYARGDDTLNPSVKDIIPFSSIQDLKHKVHNHYFITNNENNTWINLDEHRPVFSLSGRLITPYNEEWNLETHRIKVVNSSPCAIVYGPDCKMTFPGNKYGISRALGKYAGEFYVQNLAAVKVNPADNGNSLSIKMIDLVNGEIIEFMDCHTVMRWIGRSDHVAHLLDLFINNSDLQFDDRVFAIKDDSYLFNIKEFTLLNHPEFIDDNSIIVTAESHSPIISEPKIYKLDAKSLFGRIINSDNASDVFIVQEQHDTDSEQQKIRLSQEFHLGVLDEHTLASNKAKESVVDGQDYITSA